MAVPENRYAKTDHGHVAYQVLGDGPIDLLGLTSGTNVWIDRDDEPHWNRFDRRLASFSRLIRFDPIGVGLSDPLAGGATPTLEGWIEDAVAVLDAVGSTSAALFGVGIGGLVAMLLSASHPQRLSAQVLMHAYPRAAQGEDYAFGYPQEVIDDWIDTVTDPSRQGDSIDDLALTAPSLVDDGEFRGGGSAPASDRVPRSPTRPTSSRCVLTFGPCSR